MNKSNLRKVFEKTPANYEKLIRLENILDNQKSPFKIVVYGKYNHGKSTFLNAWLNQSELFNTSDKRETVINQEYFDQENNIAWIDTPGLDAHEQDDAEAQEAVKEADIILLVHDIISGELDEKELKMIESFSMTNKQKLKLLLTKIDQNEDNLPLIINNIENQINHFAVKLFPISPIRYQKYSQTSIDKWKQASRFEALQIEIQKSISDRDDLRKQEIMGLCDDLTLALNSKKKAASDIIYSMTQQIETKQNNCKRDAQNKFNSL